MDIYEKIVELKGKGIRAALATVVAVEGSTPGKPAFKLLVTESGDTFGSVGGGCMESNVVAAAREVIRAEEARLLSFTLSEEEEKGPEGLICGGKAEVYIEPIVTPHIILMGAGHVAKAIAQVGKLAGFGLAVVDDREEYANEERFPGAAKIVVLPFDKALADIPVSRSSYFAIVTRTHQQDEACLRQALKTDAAYIGMIGSQRKVEKIFSRLLADGFRQEDLDRVHAPIGLEIGAETSEEIAVSVIAQMIQKKRAKRTT